jgi:hypothetical protein
MVFAGRSRSNSALCPLARLCAGDRRPAGESEEKGGEDTVGAAVALHQSWFCHTCTLNNATHKINT